MRKLVIVLTAALLALAICAAALAENAANDLYNDVADLLFRTNNVTLNATAEFSLDGTWFKTAEGTWKQDMDRSWRQLILRSPKMDGTERRNGYTIVCEGQKIWLMEVFTPGVYRDGSTAARTSILRRSVETEQMIRLAGALAGEANLLLGADTVTKTADGEICFRLGEDAPDLVNSVLNQVVRFAAKRYFGMDYDRLSSDNGLSMNSFTTVSEGILYAMRNVTLRKAEMRMRPDANGGVQHVEGEICLYLETAVDGIHQLDVTFWADVTDRGTTMVRKFDPAEYNVKPAGDYTDYGWEDSGEFIGEDDTEDVSQEMMDDFVRRATDIWSRTGFDMASATGATFSVSGNVCNVVITGGDGTTRRTSFMKDGRFLGIEAEPNDWQQVNISKYTYDPVPDPETDSRAKEFLMSFLKEFSPEMTETVKDLKMEWIYEVNGAEYAQYNEYPLNQEGDGVLFVVRLSPELRIEYYTCVSNG